MLSILTIAIRSSVPLALGTAADDTDETGVGAFPFFDAQAVAKRPQANDNKLIFKKLYLIVFKFAKFKGIHFFVYTAKAAQRNHL